MPTKPVSSFEFFSPTQKQGFPANYGGAGATAFIPSTDYGVGGYRTDVFAGPSGIAYSNAEPGTANLLRLQDKFNQQRLFTDVAFEKGREDISRQFGAIGQGFDKAEGALQRYGRSQRQTALDRETQLAGELSARSGGQSYLYDYYRRSLSQDTTRSLMQVDEQLGQLFAGLYTQRGLTEAGILGSRAGTYLQQADVYQSLLGQQVSAELGYAPGDQGPRDYSGIYELIGSLSQAYAAS